MTTTAAIICTRKNHALAKRALAVFAPNFRHNERIVGHGDTWHVVRDLQLYDLDPETGVLVVRTVTYTGPEAHA